MGKGDRRTRKGKISVGSFGKVRPKSNKKVAKVVKATETVETKTEEKAEE